MPFSQFIGPFQSFAQSVYPPPDESNENSGGVLDNLVDAYPEPPPLSTQPSNYQIDTLQNNIEIYLPIIFNSYSRATAVQYADRWAHDRNIYSFPVYANDCTNFVSQVLYTGGIPLIGLHNYDYGAWWYAYLGNFLFENSNTWSATDWLYTHATYYRQDLYQRVDSINNLQSGDFFLVDLDPSDQISQDHARVAIGWGYVEEGDQIGEFRFLASQHTADRKRTRWNYNLDETTPVWFFHVR